MTRVLIGNKNIEIDLKNFQFLQNNGEYEIITSDNGREMIDICRSVKPNIIIFNSDFQDMPYTDIIDKISTLPEENNRCNLILTVNNEKDKQLLKNTSILYEIFDYPIDSKRAKETIGVLKEKYNKPDITVSEVNNLLLRLGMNVYSLGCQCLISAIFKCYYHPEAFFTLDNIYKIVANEYNLTKEEVKNKIRHSIDTINTSTNIFEDGLYIKIFRKLQKYIFKSFYTNVCELSKYIKKQGITLKLSLAFLL